MMRKLLVIVIGFMAPLAEAAAPRPNIMHIVADDLGWGDVGFNGQTKIKTPNLDSLRDAGLAMLNGYCPASVCAPTRAAMLTGFHNGHTFVDRNGVDIDTGFRFEDVMIGRVLQSGGYRTGIIGKWGLGGTDSGTDALNPGHPQPPDLGYNEFYGYLSHSRAHNYYQQYLWQTDATGTGVERVSSNNTYTHDLFQARALQFITNSANSSQPFYLEFAPTIPHDSTADITNVPGWDAEYTGSAYSSWTAGQKQYAAMITRMDAGIGQLMARLNDPNGDGNNSDSVADNTLVIFTSDNGPTNQTRTNFFDSNGPYRGGKRDLTEGGLRTPWIMAWPGQIAPGTSNHRIIGMTDLLPTLAEIAGVTETPVGMDGVSFAPIITGEGVLRNRDFYIFEGHESSGGPLSQGPQLWAVRKGDWKLIKWGDGTFRLYNLANDPFEGTNIVASNPTIKAELEALALFEGVEQPTNYAMTYRTWTGGNNASVNADENWSGAGTPDNTWSAVVDNTIGGNRIASVNSDLTFLGFGVRATTGTQRVIVNSGVTLTGQNEIRISPNSQLDLLDATLRTSRWVDVRAGGTLFGRGDVFGDIYNSGTVSANGGTLKLHGSGVHSGVFNVGISAILELVGGTHILNGGTFIGSGIVRVNGASVLAHTPSLTINNLEILDAGRVDLAPGGEKTLKATSLAITGAGAKLDVSDNKLIVASQPNAGVFNPSTGRYGGVSGLLQSGRNGGNWDGAGVITSQSAADGNSALTTLAVAFADDVGRVGTSFGDRIVNSGDVLVMYTWSGDANLSGNVDADDYFAIDSNYNKPSSSLAFSRGDFNYDGVISADDYFIIDSGFSGQSAALSRAGVATVPEPALGSLALLALMWCSSRRGR